MKSGIVLQLILCLSGLFSPVFAQKSILDDEIISLVAPIQLGATETRIIVRDYFQDPSKLEGVRLETTHARALYMKDSGEIIIYNDSEMPLLSWMYLDYGGKTFSILLKKNQKQLYRFVFKEMGGKAPDHIFIKSSFNNWSPDADALVRNDGSKEWVSEKWLDPGTHVYKYVVNGIEMNDPYNPETLPNGLGGSNSVVHVPSPDPAKLPQISFADYSPSKKIISIQVEDKNSPDKNQFFVLWQNQNIDYVYDKKKQIISIAMPKEAVAFQRSHIRVFCMNQKGISNDLLIPLENGKVLEDPSKLTRQDWQSMILYFSMVDRFNNGDKTNDRPLADSRLLPIQNYFGGDIKGITQKIKSGYFKELGMNTIWLSPITQNPWEAYQEFPQPRRWYSGYHGYWPMYTTSVDRRFGNDQDLHELVETAHAEGMNVLLDYVCHHVHSTNKMYQEHKEWFTPLHLKDGTTNIRIWDAQRLTTWFDDFLPTLDLSKPEVADIQSDSALFWIKKYNLDGFRHDATKHVPTEFWRTLTRKMKTDIILKEKRPVYQIGETFGNNELIQSYLGAGLLDAQFNFNLYFDIRDQFSVDNGDMSIIGNSLRQSCNYFGFNNTMGVITGNHDLTRFMGLASKAVKPDEDPKEAGYARDIQIIDRKGFRKLSMLLGFIMTVPGIPVIYYGDEIGMVGAGDPDNRRPMKFEGLDQDESKTKKLCSYLAKFRSSHLALIYGSLNFLRTDKELLLFERTYLRDKVWVGFNSSNQDKEIVVEYNGKRKIKSFDGRTIKKKNGKYAITIPPQSFEIIFAQK